MHCSEAVKRPCKEHWYHYGFYSTMLAVSKYAKSRIYFAVILVKIFSLSRDVSQRKLVGFYRLSPIRIFLDCCSETLITTNLRWITSQKSEDLVYTAAEVWNRAKLVALQFIRKLLSFVSCEPVISSFTFGVFEIHAGRRLCANCYNFLCGKDCERRAS
jgi:hypothetical protein